MAWSARTLLSALAIALASVPASPCRAELDSAPGDEARAASWMAALDLAPDLSDDPALGIRRVLPWQILDPIPRECEPKYMAGPAVGIAMTPVIMMGGVTMMVAGSWWIDDRTATDKTLVGLGSVAFVSAIALATYSGIKLHRRRAARWEVCGGKPTGREPGARTAGFSP